VATLNFTKVKTKYYLQDWVRLKKRIGRTLEMVREFEYKGEVFRVNYHGIAGHEEIIIVHLEDRVLEEGGEISIDRMTEENDTSAPIEDIIVMLCDQLIPERGIQVSDPNGPFTWRQMDARYEVHDGTQDDGFGEWQHMKEVKA
jgi:hypothetical protein